MILLQIITNRIIRLNCGCINPFNLFGQLPKNLVGIEKSGNFELLF